MFFDNFSKLCEERNISCKKAAQEIGLSNSITTKWKKTGAIPNGETLNKIAAYFGVTVNDLLIDMESAISHAFNVVPVGKQGMRPIYGSISAGLGEFVEGDNEILGWEPVEEKYDTDEYFYLRVVGDSMSPKIEDGDLLLIRKQASVDSGDIGAFLVDGEEGYVKRVKYDTDYITFISLNPAYEPITFLGAEVQRVQVVGKVIKAIKNL